MSASNRLPLSVLDLSPVSAGSPGSQALHDTVALARVAERAGYHRYWLAEHHNIASVTSSAPEVMIAAVAAATERIRVGSGGIMLPNHSPLKVAETFRVLAGLHPGRIDLGIGRAPGTDQLTALALRRSRQALAADDFPEQYSELLAYVDGFPAGHPLESVSAMPGDVPLPPVWILGSSMYGAQAAAAFGTGSAFAGHFGGGDPREAVSLYRENFQPSQRSGAAGAQPRAMLGVAAICAETEERAEQLALVSDLAMVRLRSGRPQPLATPADAAAHPWTHEERALARSLRRFVTVGTPQVVHEDLLARAGQAGVDELIITASIHDQEERRRSYELIADAFDLASAPVARAC